MTDTVRPKNKLSTIASAIMQVMTIPASIPPDFKVDAIVTFCCMGETEQITAAIDEWEKNVTARQFLIAGPSTNEKTYIDLTLDNLIQPPYNLQRTRYVLHQEVAKNTPDQMNWIIQQINNLGLSKFIIFLPAYHATRAYLTLVKAIRKFPHDIFIAIPRFTSVPLDSIVPEAGVAGRLLVADEMRKIQLYQEKGDVATLSELEEYLDYTLFPTLDCY